MGKTGCLSTCAAPEMTSKPTASVEKKRAYEKAGRRAETYAALYLRAKGYKILERRFKTQYGEIDIIARHDDTLVIVEVKQRANRLAAHEAITHTAERRISDATDIYVGDNPEVQSLGIRFDALFFIGPATKLRWDVEHIIDAWRADE